MICVDSSVVVKWILLEELSDQAHALRQAAADVETRIVAPALLSIEVNNVIFRRTRRPDSIDFDTAARLLDSFLESEIHLHDPATLHRKALVLASTYQLPAVYDAYYLALADEVNCPFWTADQRLLRTLNGRLPFVHWIGDFHA